MMLPSNYDYIDTLVESYNSDYENCMKLHNDISETPKHIISYVFEPSHYGLLYSKDNLEHRIKSHYWREVFNRSNLSDILSSKQKSEITKSFDNDLPDFNRFNVEETLRSWYENSNTLFYEKVSLCFERLSGEHITNQPQGFTKKIIFKNLVDYTWFPKTFNFYSFKNYGLDVIHDLRTSIQTLFNIPLSSHYDTKLILQTINERNEYTSFDNGAFKVKIFKNGNSHIELHPHVAIALNIALSKAYPNAIPPKHRTKTEEIKEYTFTYTHLSEKVKEELRNFIMYCDILKDNETGENIISFKKLNKKSFYVAPYIKEILDFIDVKEVIPHQEYRTKFNIVEVIRHIIVNGIVDYKTNQFYPTPDSIVDSLMTHIDGNIERDNIRILEPSAGRGSISNRFENIDCIEKEELNTVFLKQNHKNVIHGDFLFYNITKEKDKYDLIVMNPPYNKKQWKTHVLHALKILKDNGTIFAILPQGKEHEFENCEMLETYTNEFDNTTITTCLYKITK